MATQDTIRRMEPDPDAQAKLRAFFELSPVILIITGLEDGRVREVNDAFLELGGFERDAVVGRHVLDLNLWLDPGQRDAGVAALRAGQPVRDFTARFRVKGGEERVCVLAAELVVIGGETCILTALTDITDRTRAEEALRESERRFMLLFHANPLPMTITALHDGRHLEVNDAAVRHGGYTREEMLGRTKPELGFWVASEEREELLRLLHEVGRVRDFEVTFQTKRGEQRQLLVNSEVITYGGAPAVLSVSLDITERKQLEAESRARGEEAEAANRAKDEFLAMLGHELRNPLGTITSAVAVLDTLGSDEATRRLTAIIGRQTRHLGRLVDDLLDVARVTSGKIGLRTQPIDLHELTARCVDALTQAGRTREHRLTLQGAAVHVDGDTARLEQIVNNLVDNALKYTPAGGAIAVSTAREGDEAVLRVRDTGKGIRADVLGRVFDLFVQEPQALDRSRGGLGLGLTLVKRLVELHGGSVSASSAGPGQGSEFVVRLPVLATPARGGHAPVGPAPASASARRRVLIVEDSADARESLRLLLELGGHVVETSEDGPSGLAKLRAFRPEIALIDLGLPGIDGYTLARIARGQPETRGIRLVALTGYGQAEDQQRALAAGFDLHVTKPVDVAKLQAVLG
ncbi:MAG TPA: PAS domain S-box protein [Candidatus Acidoferrum sp.]|nr:PAS domain S-box protein [Candidatus Acidoferrum sp.]